MFRRDIQGLRGLAVLLVVFSHIGILPGGFIGVDVFFVVSGFVITQLLNKEFSEHGHVSLRDFYARRAKRILPASLLVIAAAVTLTTIVLGQSGSLNIYSDAIWCALFAANLRFASVGTDYFAQGVLASPLQHFWSLAVEEQFYFVWPIALMFTLWLGSRSKIISWLPHSILILAISSLAIWSVYDTNINPISAYFSAIDRSWEILFGALLALSAKRFERLATGARVLMFTVASVLLALAAMTFSDQTLYPSYNAWIPVFSAGLLLACGTRNYKRQTQSNRGVLTNPVIVWLGGISYSLYLWHWVFIILFQYKFGAPPTVFQAMILILISVTIAWLSTRFIEMPLRRNRSLQLRPISSLAIAGVTVATLVGANVVLLQPTPASVASVPLPSRTQAVSPQPPGSSSTAEEKTAFDPSIFLAAALKQKTLFSNLEPPISNPSMGDKTWSSGCLTQITSQALPENNCIYGDPHGTKTYWLIGDSHAGNWFEAVNGIAKREHAKLVFHARSSCPFIETAFFNSLIKQVYTACAKTTAWYLDRAKTSNVDTVFYGSYYYLVNNHLEANLKSFSKIAKIAKNVVVLGDTPNHTFSVPQCLAANRSDIQKCSVSLRAATFTRVIRAMEQASLKYGYTYVSTLDWVCSKKVCPPVIDSKMVYQDDHHLTAAISRWLGDALYDRVRSLLEDK